MKKIKYLLLSFLLLFALGCQTSDDLEDETPELPSDIENIIDDGKSSTGNGAGEKPIKW